MTSSRTVSQVLTHEDLVVLARLLQGTNPEPDNMSVLGRSLFEAVTRNGSDRRQAFQDAVIDAGLELIETARAVGDAGDADGGLGGFGDVEPDAWQPTLLLRPGEAALAVRTTWLDRYMKHCATLTDAPAAFHEALGLVVLSGVIGRRVVLHLAQGDQYANEWVMLIADSTLHRKSTSLDIARSMLDGVDENLLAPNDFTPQRFVAVMAEHDGQPLVFARDEFGGFYDGLNRFDYMAGLKDIMCDIYDGRRFRRERMKPRERKKKDANDDGLDQPVGEAWRYDCREPFLSIMAGTSMTRFIQVARPDDVLSGFLPRFAFEVPGPPADTDDADQDDMAIGELTDAQRQSHTALVEALSVLNVDPPQLRVERAVFTRFNAYMRDLKAEAKRSDNPNIVGVIGDRCAWKAFRTAMILTCCDEALSPTVTTVTDPFAKTREMKLAHLLRGIEIAERWRHNAIRLFGALGPSRFERQAQSMVDLVTKKPGVTRRVVMRSLKLSLKEIHDLEATLEARGELRLEKVQPAAGGPARHIYYPALSVSTAAKSTP